MMSGSGSGQSRGGQGGAASARGIPVRRPAGSARRLVAPGMVGVLAAAVLTGAGHASAAQALNRAAVTWQQTPVQMPWGNLLAVGGDGTGTPGPPASP